MWRRVGDGRHTDATVCSHSMQYTCLACEICSFLPLCSAFVHAMWLDSQNGQSHSMEDNRVRSMIYNSYQRSTICGVMDSLANQASPHLHTPKTFNNLSPGSSF